MTQSTQLYTFRIDKQSMIEIQIMAKNLNTTPTGVFSQALNLLKNAQGRTVVLKQKGKRTAIENKRYLKLPALTKLWQ